MNVVAIIQARMGSTRLPGKVLKDLVGKTVLFRCVNRCIRASELDGVVVAVPDNPADDTLASYCTENGWSLFRGSENDVLDRYYRAAVTFKVDVIVRVTSDCPLIDPGIIDRVVNEFHDHDKTDYVSNVRVRSYPRGLDVEVFHFDTLKRAWQEDTNPARREHVTPYIIQHLELFHLHGVTNPVDYSHLRWTVDTEDDLTLVRKIYDSFRHDEFSWTDVLTLLKMHPEWSEINRHIKQKEIT